jgi:hypothetical protein
VDGEQGGVAVEGVGEEEIDLAPVGLGRQAVELCAEFRLDAGIRLLVDERGQVAGVPDTAVEAVPEGELLPQARGLLSQG